MKKLVEEPKFIYKCAISFAGIHREYANAIAKEFSDTFMFYDDNNECKCLLPGLDLVQTFEYVYKKSEKVIILNSSEYSKRSWAQIECSAIKDRMLSTGWKSDFIIPVYMDDTKLDFLPNYVGYICAGDSNITTLKKPNPKELALIIKDILDNPNKIDKYLNYHIIEDFFDKMICELKKAFLDLKIIHTLNCNGDYAELSFSKSHCNVSIQLMNNYLGTNDCSIFLKYYPFDNGNCQIALTNHTLPFIVIENNENDYLVNILDNSNPFIIEKTTRDDALKLVVTKVLDLFLGGCKCLTNN